MSLKREQFSKVLFPGLAGTAIYTGHTDSTGGLVVLCQ